MTVAVIALGVLFGGLLLLGLAAAVDRHPRAPAADQTEADVSDDLVQARYVTALDALSGPTQRLSLFAAVSDELAQQCRRDAQAGRPPARLTFADDSYRLPAELDPGTVRPGPAEAWQPLDRALHRLAAIDDVEDPVVHADAHEHVSTAAQQVAGQLSLDAAISDLERCSFCGDAPAVLWSSRRASICEACVRACHQRLQDQQ
jgi:hypothetical protein